MGSERRSGQRGNERVRVAAALVLAAACAHASAADSVENPGWYLGFAGGGAKASDLTDVALGDCASSLNPPAPVVSAPGGTCGFDVDQWAPNYRIFGGVSFHPNFGFEAGYSNFGTVSLSKSVGQTVSCPTCAPAIPLTPTATDVYDSQRSYALYAAFVAKMGVTERLSVHGKLGVQRWSASRKTRADVQVLNTVPITSLTTNVKASDVGHDLYFGAGTTFRLTDHLALQLEYEHYAGIGDSDKASAGQPKNSDVNVFSAGLRLTF